MARKVRTPPPPRRAVQAPKVRTAPRDEGRNRKIVYAIAASGFVMLAIVVGFFLLAGGDDSDDPQQAISTIRAAGWSYQHPKSQGRTHVAALRPNFKYNSVPASSGPHSNQTVIYGIYDQPLEEINVVHNLEHGAVGIQYGPDVPESDVLKITEFYNEDPVGLIVSPNPKLGDQIALTSWTNVAKGKAFDEDVFDTFVDTFGFKGPESCKSSIEQGCFRRSNMEPGNQ